MKQNWVVKVFDKPTQEVKSFYVNGYTMKDVVGTFMKSNPNLMLLEVKKHEKLDKA